MAGARSARGRTDNPAYPTRFGSYSDCGPAG